MADIKVSWLQLDTAAIDVKVSWLQLDTAATPVDVRVSWLQLDTAAARVGRRFKHYAKAYLRRENEVLVFDSEDEKESFLEAEKQAAQAINRAARRAVMATVPRPAKVDLERIAQDAERLRLESITALLEQQDYERIMAVNQMIADMLDEEDIELLLTL